MTHQKNRPLVTFLLLAYNNEAFIREAVNGAFAQTYFPLEIIISDDGSTDRTFDIIQEMAANYRGPHLVYINRNPENLGTCAHVNRVMELVRGDLVIYSHGDDISLPERTQVIYEAWESSRHKAGSIYSAYTLIDEAGNIIGESLSAGRGNGARFSSQVADPYEFVSWRSKVVFGCTMAWSSKVFETFGKLPSHINNVNEDFLLGFRSVLLRSVTYIKEPLVRYRRHGNNVSAGNLEGLSMDKASFKVTEEKRLRTYTRFASAFAALACDLQTARDKGLVTADEFPKLNREITRQREMLQMTIRCIRSPGLSVFGTLCQLLHRGAGPRTIMRLLPRLLPLPLFRASKIVANHFRRRLLSALKGRKSVAQ
jgi:glycosyltransferase involved in cell wall biosynthesis